MKLILFCLLIIILEDASADQIVVCKQVDLSEFKQLTTTNQCSASVLFVEETSNNNNTTNKQSSLSIKQDFDKLKEQIQEIKNRSFQIEKLKNKLKELQEKFEAFKACSSNPCVNGNCSYSNNTYLCSCNPGYTGRNCEIDLNECETNPCLIGDCTDQVNGYKCECYSGFYGINCSTDWFPPGNGFQYKTINKVTQATAAIKECEDEGARLASAGIRNQTMQKIIFQELKLLDADYVWIGLKKTNDIWWWSDGVQLNMSDPRLNRFSTASDNLIYSYIGNNRITPVLNNIVFKFTPLCEKQLA